MEDNLNIFEMVDDLNAKLFQRNKIKYLENGRQTQFFEMENTLNFFENGLKDDLDILLNGRQSPKIKSLFGCDVIVN
jgi:hypothetical protein